MVMGEEKTQINLKEAYMSNKKTLLLIAGVAIMLAAAINAYAYTERWNGWFNSGYLEYDGYTFNYTTGESTLEDHTYGSVDSFSVSAVTPSTFTCSTGGECHGYYIKVWSDPSGCKDTGQEDQKEVKGNPTWTGYAILYNNMHRFVDDFDVGGTWNTSAGGDYFDYDPETPTYSAHWTLSISDPLGITGDGGSAGDRTYYED
jgi:hypothetical protein